MLSTWRYNVSLLPLTKILYNVPNAIAAAINEADYVAGSNDGDGVAHFIEANILSN